MKSLANPQRTEVSARSGMLSSKSRSMKQGEWMSSCLLRSVPAAITPIYFRPSDLSSKAFLAGRAELGPLPRLPLLLRE